jgi:hypothetical protein
MIPMRLASIIILFVSYGDDFLDFKSIYLACQSVL